MFTRSLPSVCYVLAPVGEHDLALALLRHQPDNTDDVEHGQLVRGRQDGARQCTLRPISGQSGDDKYANCRVVLCMAHRRRRDAPAACQRRQRACHGMESMHQLEDRGKMPTGLGRRLSRMLRTGGRQKHVPRAKASGACRSHTSLQRRRTRQTLTRWLRAEHQVSRTRTTGVQ